MFEPGRLIGSRYRVERLIGRGGMGEVYAAVNVRTGRDVALKLIRSLTVTAEHRRRFLREAKAATAIKHPNVIDVLDVFDDDGLPIMVMELLEGESLASLLKRRHKLTLATTAALLLPVAQALKVAHDKGIVHRDLKPDNIFLARDEDGGVDLKVLDFGIAKVLDPTVINAETDGGETQTGSVMGTPHYMSFEQAMSDKDIDHRTDIWALGVILFEALVGERPLAFDTMGQMYQMFLQGAVPSVRERLPELDEEVATVVDHCLKKDRSERLPDLGPLIEVLEPFSESQAIAMLGREVQVAAPTVTGRATQDPVAATRFEGAPHSSSWWWLAAAGGIVLAAMIGFAVTGNPPANHRGATVAASAPSAAVPMPRESVGAPEPTQSTVSAEPTASPSTSANAHAVDAGPPPMRPATPLPFAPPSSAPPSSAPPSSAPLPKNEPATGPHEIPDEPPY